MSDSAAIPPFNPAAIESTAANRAGTRDDQRAEIIRLPKDLREIKTPRNVKGEVIRADREGHVTLRTEHGTVELRTKNKTHPRQGEALDIRLPAGKPPIQAHIRPTAGPKQPIQAPDTGPTTENQINITPDKAPLEANRTIPLKPLNAQALQRLIQPFIETIPSQALIQTVDFTAQIIKGDLTSEQSALITTNTPGAPPPLTILQTPEPLPPALENQRNTILPYGLDKQSLRRFLPLIGEAFIQTGTTETLVSEGLAPTAPRTGKALIAGIQPPQIQLINPGEEGIPLTSTREQTAARALPDGKAETLKGIVVAFTPEQNFPVLRLTAPPTREGQYFSVPAPTQDIPLGTTMELTPQQPLTPGQAPTAPLPTPVPVQQSIPSLYFTTPESWTLLQEVQQALAHVSSQSAQAFSNIIPSPANPAQFGPAALFFLAAVRSGDVTNWLGERAADILKGGRGNLLSRLTQEFSQLSRFTAEQPAQDWRSAALPLAWDNDIHKIVIHYRKEDRHSGEEESQNGQNTRFVINLSLSNVGPVQLDALFQGNPSSGGRLDLILRAGNDFSAAMKAEMRRAYKSALDKTAITGELSFQNSSEGWVSIQTQSRNIVEDV